jgi:hypothetical protein
LVALLAAAWAVDHTRSENVRQADQIETLERDGSRAASVIEQQAAAIAAQQALQVELLAISTSTRKIQQALDGQTAQIRRDLQELKRTDETIEPYLRGLVPSAIGLRYERRETTDPATYRAGAGVRVSAVPVAGPPAPASE